jgi:hypothetical protein
MWLLLAELITDLLLWFQDIKFWFKKRKRRKFEKEHGLPKKFMLYPSQKIFLIGTPAIIILYMLSFFLFVDINQDITRNKIVELIEILEKEKEDIGRYPDKIRDVVRNNPLRQSVIFDSWKQEFYYESFNNGTTFKLQSLGSDGELGTSDDIKHNE